MKIVISEQMRQIEQECARIGLPTSELMENAGKAVAEEIGRILWTTDRQHILFLIGPGNNGGGGLEAARPPPAWGGQISIYPCPPRKGGHKLESIPERGI